MIQAGLNPTKALGQRTRPFNFKQYRGEAVCPIAGQGNLKNNAYSHLPSSSIAREILPAAWDIKIWIDSNTLVGAHHNIARLHEKAALGPEKQQLQGLHLFSTKPGTMSTTSECRNSLLHAKKGEPAPAPIKYWNMTRHNRE
jgi:hypothetical protein